jgi:hypothetical protein
MARELMMENLMPWNVSGSYFEVCNCEAVCPCRRRDGQKGGIATYETCDFALSWWIKDGRAGAIDLAGTKVVMTGSFVEKGSNPWSVILYVDDRATEAQRAALVELFLGRAGGSAQKNFAMYIAEVHATKTARIELDHTPNAERIDVAPYLTVRTREAAAVPAGSVSCGIPGHDHPGQEIVAEIFRYQDPPYDWEFRGKCGFATTFSYSSA